ncbi:MAG: hypothetical protein LBJ61_04710, partial [Deltaproteobacteria bacterium]|nr:hypothetical protein [Deltaproteobacteria bacterium]
WDGDRLTESARESLAEIFARPKTIQRHAPFKRPELNLAPWPTLITAMGRLSDATLLAIVGHNLPQVVLAYTPEDEWVAHMATVYAERARELGLRKVQLLPTDYLAANLHAHLPAELAGRATVNVTPGTKPQGMALGLWAKNHGVPAWAIERETIRRLDKTGETMPVRGLSLKARLDFTVETQVTDYGWGNHSPDWNNDLPYQKLLRFMNLALDRGLAGDLRRRDLELDGFGLVLIDRVSRLWRFGWPAEGGRGAGTLDLLGGFWYEKLAAKAVDALNHSGRVAWDVSCGVEVSSPGSDRYLTERDVLAANSRAQLFMVSCKTAARPKDKFLAMYAAEALAMAKTLGRFVVPVICDMSTDPPKTVEGVMAIGWTTLCRPKALSAALESAAKAVHG